MSEYIIAFKRLVRSEKLDKLGMKHLTRWKR